MPKRRRDELVSLVRHGNEQNWWRFQDGRLPTNWYDLMCFEREAIVIRDYETMVVPGLLQTAEYRVALTRAMYADVTEEELDRQEPVRAERQTLLNKIDAPDLCFVIEEAVLRRQAGAPGMMYRQLQHLMSTARRGKADIRVVPASAGLHPGVTGPFLVLEFADHPSLVCMEPRTSTAFAEAPDHVVAVKKAFRRLRLVALSREDSVDLIASIGNELLDVVEEPRDGKLGPVPCSLAQEQP